jgi:hypothetical protein
MKHMLLIHQGDTPRLDLGRLAELQAEMTQ